MNHKLPGISLGYGYIAMTMVRKRPDAKRKHIHHAPTHRGSSSVMFTLKKKYTLNVKLAIWQNHHI